MGSTIDIPSYEAPSTLVDPPPVVSVEGSGQHGAYSEVVVPDNYLLGSTLLSQLQGSIPIRTNSTSLALMKRSKTSM